MIDLGSQCGGAGMAAGVWDSWSHCVNNSEVGKGGCWCSVCGVFVVWDSSPWDGAPYSQCGSSHLNDPSQKTDLFPKIVFSSGQHQPSQVHCIFVPSYCPLLFPVTWNWRTKGIPPFEFSPATLKQPLKDGSPPAPCVLVPPLLHLSKQMLESSRS